MYLRRVRSDVINIKKNRSNLQQMEYIYFSVDQLPDSVQVKLFLYHFYFL